MPTLNGNPKDENLKVYLQSVLKRMLYQHFLYYLLLGFSIAGILIVLLLVFSFLFPWPQLNRFCVITASCSIGFLILLANVRRPGLWDAACFVDSHGLKERVTTAWEMEAQDSEILRMQREDALQHLRLFDAEKEIKISIPSRTAKICASTIMLSIVLLLLPNPMQPELEKAKAVKTEIQAKEKNVEKVKKELEEDNLQYPDANREQAIAALEELEKKLHKADKMEEALKALSAAEEKLNKLQEQEKSAKDDMQGLISSLQEQELGRKLADSVSKGDIEDSRKQVQGIKSQQGKEIEQKKEELAGSLEKASQQMQDSQLKQTTQQLASSLCSKDNRNEAGSSPG